MRNPDWIDLTDAEKGQLVSLWLLAADNNGVIVTPTRRQDDANMASVAKYLRKVCFFSEDPHLQTLIDHGFIKDWRQGDVKVASTRRQGDALEKRREEKSREEESREEESREDLRAPEPNCSLAFAEFWEAYPRKIGKAAALKAWKKLGLGEELERQIVKAISAQVDGQHFLHLHNGQQQEMIPLPTTWLNQGRWDDEIMPTAEERHRESVRRDLERSEEDL